MSIFKTLSKKVYRQNSIYYMIHLYEILKRAKVICSDANLWLTMARGCGWGLTTKGQQEIFGGDGNILYYGYVMLIQLYSLIVTH